MASETLHEDPAKLGPDTIDRHRAISSLMEELEAVDWYDQRVKATANEELRTILAHNRDEEKEHAAMVLEWLRRQDPVLDEHLRTFLFSKGSIVGEEAAMTGGGSGEGSGEAAPAKSGDGSLGIGSLKRAGGL
ncbi:MAG: ferritin-like domain-containing protein [Dongiaceae bacterium]